MEDATPYGGTKTAPPQAPSDVVVDAPLAQVTMVGRRDVALATAPAALHATLKAQAESAEMIEQYIREKLRPGEDFGVAHNRKTCRDLSWQGWGRCPSCHSKPELWLPGAERILWILGCTTTEPEIARDLMDAVKVEGAIVFRVRVISRSTGEVLGYGLGARRLAQDQNDPNKCLKMGAKSALIDAVKRTFALSGFFTQDGGADDQTTPTHANGTGARRAGEPRVDPGLPPGPTDPTGSPRVQPEVGAPEAAPVGAATGAAPGPAPAPGDEAWIDRVREKLGLSWDWIYALARHAGATWSGAVHRVSPNEWAIVRAWLTDELRPKLKKGWTADQKEVAAKLWIREWTGWDGTNPAPVAAEAS